MSDTKPVTHYYPGPREDGRCGCCGDSGNQHVCPTVHRRAVDAAAKLRRAAEALFVAIDSLALARTLVREADDAWWEVGP